MSSRELSQCAPHSTHRKTDRSVSKLLPRPGLISIQPIVRIMLEHSSQALIAPDAPLIDLIQEYYLLALPLHARSARVSVLDEVSS